MLITNVVYLCKSVQFCGEYEFSTPSFIFSSMSVDHVKSAVGNQCFRNPDTLRSLMVFQQGCYDAGQCQCRSVQCVAKFGFLFSATICGILIDWLGKIIEVRYRADFQPALLCFGIYFEIKAKRSGKTHITTTETENTVREFQLLE